MSSSRIETPFNRSVPGSRMTSHNSESEELEDRIAGLESNLTLLEARVPLDRHTLTQANKDLIALYKRRISMLYQSRPSTKNPYNVGSSSTLCL